MRILAAISKFSAPPDVPEDTTHLCCEQVGVPPCDKQVRAFGGMGQPDLPPGGETRWPIVWKVLRRPAGGRCGDEIKRWQRQQKNCCAGADAVAWDAGRSVSVLADGQSGLIFAAGGLGGAYRWAVNGVGFSFASGRTRDVWTTAPYIELFAGQTMPSCGTAIITVTDGCTEAQGPVRSVNGRWADGQMPRNEWLPAACGNSCGQESTGCWRPVAAYGFFYETFVRGSQKFEAWSACNCEVVPGVCPAYCGADFETPCPGDNYLGDSSALPDCVAHCADAGGGNSHRPAGYRTYRLFTWEWTC